MNSNDQHASRQVSWHALEAQDVLDRLATDQYRGLSGDEVLSRQKQFGPNRLPPPRKRPWWMRVLLQFHNVLIYVMPVAAAITASLGHWIDTGVLLAAVLVNAGIGFIQEGKAEKALDTIRAMLSLHTAVIREGIRKDIAVDQLVPGDMVVLASGDKVPADIRLAGGKGLRVNEAILTGESDVVEKTVTPVVPDALLGDRKSMLYSGTQWMRVLLASALLFVVAELEKMMLGRFRMRKAADTTTSAFAA